MSASKARLVVEGKNQMQRRVDAEMRVIRLLNYVVNMQEDYPDLPWPDLPDTYNESTWRAVL